MFPTPLGYRVVEKTAAGTWLTSITEGDGSVIQYTRGLRPLGAANELVRAWGAPRDYTVTHMSAAEPFVTVEGEHAALVVTRAVRSGQTVERTFAFVFGDEWYDRVVGVAFEPARFAGVRETVREIARTNLLLLGIRRRPVLHAAPKGWRAVSEHLETTWHADSGARLLVHPATPGHVGLGPFAATLFGAAPGKTGTPVRTRHGLVGTSWWRELPGGGSLHAVLLSDPTYLYGVQLLMPGNIGPELTQLFELVASIEPVPRPPATDALSSLSACWV